VIICDFLGMVVNNWIKNSTSMVLVVGALQNPNGAGRGTERDTKKFQ
jgi:hypothetical protein